jgi:hypothetical protein
MSLQAHAQFITQCTGEFVSMLCYTSQHRNHIHNRDHIQNHNHNNKAWVVYTRSILFILPPGALGGVKQIEYKPPKLYGSAHMDAIMVAFRENTVLWHLCEHYNTASVVYTRFVLLM